MILLRSNITLKKTKEGVHTYSTNELNEHISVLTSSSRICLLCLSSRSLLLSSSNGEINTQIHSNKKKRMRKRKISMVTNEGESNTNRTSRLNEFRNMLNNQTKREILFNTLYDIYIMIHVPDK